MDFVPFPKIARLRREVVVTEKIDGSNAGIFVPEEGPLRAAKRSGWIELGPTDNFWFAQWVADNADALRTGLGPGMHWGEWWGERVNRRYPTVAGRRFSLFNTERWRGGQNDIVYGPKATPAPSCCLVVPVLARLDRIDDKEIEDLLAYLRKEGSLAAPGCKAEGLVVHHTASRVSFKVTCEKDDEPKSRPEA